MTDHRILLVDAAVTELTSQLGDDCVRRDGETRVTIQGTVKMARVIEAVMNVALGRPEEKVVKTVVHYLGMDKEDIIHPEDTAADLLLDVLGHITDTLDPLP